MTIEEAIPFLSAAVKSRREELGMRGTDSTAFLDAIETLLALASDFLKAREGLPKEQPCPGKVIPVEDIHNKGEVIGYIKGYNSALDDIALCLVKKCEGLEDIILMKSEVGLHSRPGKTFTENRIIDDQMRIKIKDLTQAIKAHILGGSNG